MKISKKSKNNEKIGFKPSVRVPRAKTRLKVYRSPLVGFGSIERLIIKYIKKCMQLTEF